MSTKDQLGRLKIRFSSEYITGKTIDHKKFLKKYNFFDFDNGSSMHLKETLRRIQLYWI